MVDSNNSDCPTSWRQHLRAVANRPIHRKNIVDDGFFSQMAEGADFESLLEIVKIKPPREHVRIDGAVPFSRLNKAGENDCTVFFENDPLFADALLGIEEFSDELLKRACSTTDCSIYWDMPFVLQCANVYMSRLFGHALQELGHEEVYPTLRWADERTYKPYITEVPIAFLGLPKKSVYWIGSYGVCKTREEKFHLKAGLESALEYLQPKKLLIYGAMPSDIFGDYLDCTNFIQFPDWTTRQHGP